MCDEPLIEVISVSDLRAMHNDRQLWHRAQTGEGGWFYTVEERGHPSAPKADEEFCTHSEMLAYRDDRGRQVCRAHRYLRPDGSIGGTAEQPDPKEILGEDCVLYVAFEPEDDC